MAHKVAVQLASVTPTPNKPNTKGLQTQPWLVATYNRPSFPKIHTSGYHAYVPLAPELTIVHRTRETWCGSPAPHTEGAYGVRHQNHPPPNTGILGSIPPKMLLYRKNVISVEGVRVVVLGGRCWYSLPCAVLPVCTAVHGFGVIMSKILVLVAAAVGEYRVQCCSFREGGREEEICVERFRRTIPLPD